MQENRKTRYTKKVIFDALTELSQEKALNKITVKELCEKADINRSTFYSHYETMDQLIKTVEIQAANELISSVHVEHYADSNFKEQAIVGFLEMLIQNKSTAFWLLDSHVTGVGMKIIHDTTEEIFVSKWLQNGRVSEQEAHYFFEYVFEGTMGQVLRWYRNPGEISLEDFRKIFSLTVMNAISIVH